MFAAWAIAAIATGLSGLIALALISFGDAPQFAPLFATGASVTLVAAGLLLLTSRHRRLVASLTEAASTDPLTDLLNRRAFQERMEQELARSRREKTALTLVVADLDDFKEINDQLGHLGGDMALERVAAVISRSLRTGDIAARLGGEEFAIVAPGATIVEALSLAERLRSSLEHAFRETPVPLTVSLGVASFPEHGQSTEQLLGVADRAMYGAKALGKNRCAIHGAEAGVPMGRGTRDSIAVVEPDLALRAFR